MVVDDRVRDGVLDRVPEPDAGSDDVKRYALASVVALAVGACAVLLNELRNLGRLLADALNGRPR